MNKGTIQDEEAHGQRGLIVNGVLSGGCFLDLQLPDRCATFGHYAIPSALRTENPEVATMIRAFRLGI